MCVLFSAKPAMNSQSGEVGDSHTLSLHTYRHQANVRQIICVCVLASLKFADLKFADSDYMALSIIKAFKRPPSWRWTRSQRRWTTDTHSRSIPRPIPNDAFQGNACCDTSTCVKNKLALQGSAQAVTGIAWPSRWWTAAGKEGRQVVKNVPNLCSFFSLITPLSKFKRLSLTMRVRNAYICVRRPGMCMRQWYSSTRHNTWFESHSC